MGWSHPLAKYGSCNSVCGVCRLSWSAELAPKELTLPGTPLREGWEESDLGQEFLCMALCIAINSLRILADEVFTVFVQDAPRDHCHKHIPGIA